MMENYLIACRTAGNAGVHSSNFKEFVENLPKSAEALCRQSWNTLENALVNLGQPGVDRGFTLGALGILAAKTKHVEYFTNFEPFVLQFNTYLNNADIMHLRLCPSLLSEICQNVASIFIKKQVPLKGINLMMSAVAKIQSNPRQLTSAHAPLLELCLASSSLKTALPYLIDDTDDFTIDLKGSECKPLLLYFYYGGMIYLALKKYPQSIYFFEACIRVPAATLSHIMLEAYKKFVLVSLIDSGELKVPKCASQLINRVLKPASQPYCDLANSFNSHNPVDLNNVIIRHQEVFRRDGNFGLTKQVKLALTKLNIQRLTKTFLTLSLADVASRVQLPGGAQQAENYILSMIQDGEIYAKINQKDGMVVFLDNKEKYDSPKMMEAIENQISTCINLNKRMVEMNTKISTNPEYIQKILLSVEDEGISTSKIPAFGNM